MMQVQGECIGEKKAVKIRESATVKKSSQQ